jgi:hypothetical protein
LLIKRVLKNSVQARNLTSGAKALCDFCAANGTGKPVPLSKTGFSAISEPVPLQNRVFSNF